MRFQDLPIKQELCDVLETLSYHHPTKIQEAVIPLLDQGKDVMMQSHTGSGKTLAYLLPILSHIDWHLKTPQALILSPTRELTLQIQEEVLHMGIKQRIRSVACIGQVPYAFQKQDLQQKTHIVCGTIGRVLEHLQNETLSVSNLRYLVIDEIDEMITLGFLDKLEQILTYLPSCITCVCSATIDDAVKTWIHTHFPTMMQIQEQEEAMHPQTLHLYYQEVEDAKKLTFLKQFLCKEKPESAIIFANTKETVEKIAQELKAMKFSVAYLHGGLLQIQRQEILEKFRYGDIQFLVASDVAARGLDIAEITWIINYEFPIETARFYHRIGRSGRMKHQGHACTMVNAWEKEKFFALQKQDAFLCEPYDGTDLSMQSCDAQAVFQVHQACKKKSNRHAVLKEDITRLYINKGKKKKISARDIVGAICRIDGVSGEDIGVIQIEDHASFVDIHHGLGEKVQQALQSTTIKGKAIKVEIAKKR